MSLIATQCLDALKARENKRIVCRADQRDVPKRLDLRLLMAIGNDKFRAPTQAFQIGVALLSNNQVSAIRSHNAQLPTWNGLALAPRTLDLELHTVKMYSMRS